MGGMGAGFYFQIWVSKYGVKKKFSDPNMGFRVWVPKKKPIPIPIFLKKKKNPIFKKNTGKFIVAKN